MMCDIRDKEDAIKERQTPKQKFKCCICGKEFEMEPYLWMPKKVPCNECLKDMVIP